MSLRSSNLIRDLLVSEKLQDCAVLCQKMMLRPSIVGSPEDVNLRYLIKVCNLNFSFLDIYSNCNIAWVGYHAGRQPIYI